MIPNDIMGTVTVGNCAELMPLYLPDECIDLTVTSPPYGKLRDYKGYTFDYKKVIQQLFRVTKQGGVVVWVVADETEDGDESGESFRQALYFKEAGFKLYQTLIYSKSGFRYPRPNAYHKTHEYMFVCSKGIPKTVNLLMDRKNLNNKANAGARKHMKREKNGEFTGRKAYEPREYGVRYTVWDYTVGSDVAEEKFAFKHPAIYPENLARDHILSWSNPNDIVLDPMCGSGTTLKMAKETGRQFLGFEISEEYSLIGLQRIEVANLPLFQLA